ncbi:cysteine methyltransferase [Stenotrophomonas panacihumi]|uniref:Cysteine methyltransferase n=2 Tax=Stenotrophomonas panacihumi TaxID=676599 RepID=A0A0R0AIS0_9GAMM|nr:cysteine methyltransferase [Stenotrophomonas panacihumi]PTN54973.1 methylated-DNA--protein-cysteine methyltransferase [Stenotrophomonas panacihumi]
MPTARKVPAPRVAPKKVVGAPKPAPMPADEAKLRILRAIRAIPAGQVAGYGEVAARAGLPGRARLVARVLGGNEDPDLPWHRVLRSDGRIAMPEGSRGWREQSQRLRAEGVRVERGRVKRAPPAKTLDAALWGPPQG